MGGSRNGGYGVRRGYPNKVMEARRKQFVKQFVET
jgi:hypothetical protein